MFEVVVQFSSETSHQHIIHSHVEFPLYAFDEGKADWG